MAQTRFTCIVTKADEPARQSYARVTLWTPDQRPGPSPARRGSPQRHHRRTPDLSGIRRASGWGRVAGVVVAGVSAAGRWGWVRAALVRVNGGGVLRGS